MIPFSIDTVRALAPRGAAVRYLPNPGNLGDALIAAAAYAALRRADVPFQIGVDGASPDDVFVLAGGGNLVPMYRDTARALTWARDHTRGPVVLLPHTVAGHDDLLATLDSRFVLFAREETSFAHLKAVCSGAQVGIDHDLAFSLDVDALHAQALAELPQASAAAMRLREAIFRGTLEHAAQTAGRARLLRRDVERPRDTPPVAGPVFDMSALADSDWRDEALCRQVVDAVLLALASFADVSTNRLHLAIGRALMGLPVTMLANAYYKNRAVYEFSMAGYFDSVRWGGLPPAPAATQAAAAAAGACAQGAAAHA